MIQQSLSHSLIPILLRGLGVLLAGALAVCGGPSQATTLPAVVPDAVNTTPVDPCQAPEVDAAAGTPAWEARDTRNIGCARQRIVDLGAQPAVLFPSGKLPTLDAYRVPTRQAGVRFRFEQLTVPNRDGKPMVVEVYRPCTTGDCPQLPAALRAVDGPYPAVVIVHGGYSSRRLHWSAAQTLAEAGYMAILFDTTGPMGVHGPDTQDIVDWVFATPQKPRADGAHFPRWQDLDTRAVGIAGHSQGGSTASLIGQTDPRLSAIVAWDNLTALRTAWVDQIGIDPPANVQIRTPALGIAADYYFRPVPYAASPEPALENKQGGRGRGDGAHPKDLGFQELKAAGVDSMLVVLRGATHLDFSLFGGGASRLGEAVINYYTLAWFDRYLKGARDPALAANAHQRLTAATFDGSADRHNTSQGFYDATAATAAGDVYAGNRPYRIAGLAVRDRLSFYFSSRCHLRAPGSGVLATSDDLRRAGCAAR